MSEDELLARESETAKAAILATLADLKSDLMTAGDIRLWTRRHPWIAVGAAALTGLATGAAATMAASSAADSRNGQNEVRISPAVAVETSRKGAALGWLWGPLFDLLKTVATTLITSTVHAAAKGPPPGAGHVESNGVPGNRYERSHA